MNTSQTVMASAKAVVDQLVERRFAALNQLRSGQSMLNITVRDSGIKLLCVYKRHDRMTITIESSKAELDYLFRGQNLVLASGDYSAEEKTFNLRDIKIENG